jgi:hypothetical protein
MLDLVVEAAEHEVGEPAARNISGSDHLAAVRPQSSDLGIQGSETSSHPRLNHE